MMNEQFEQDFPEPQEAQEPQEQWREEPPRYHDEKTEEKMMEKQDEKAYEEKEEKSYEEKHRADPVGALVWAATLIWAGVVFLADNLGYLRRLQIRATDLPFELPFRPEVWTLIFLGAGVLVLIGVVLRLVIPSYRRPILGDLIWGIVLFGIALGEWTLIWPFILIAIGVSILVDNLVRRR
jgi:hypothetical protein